ncbi:neutral zinc metallopeptidase [Nonomuraea sp. NPDC048826]|uniref:neutral zinc metallopeptidase n=1 Tax=Nonomuraea sp. NPDC048826 TaxID=3364347 RepID=UPI003719940B
MIAGLGLTGTAAAATTTPGTATGTAATASLPAVLTKNRIYRSGTAGPLSCPAPEIRPGSAASIKRFQQALARCANRFWATRFKAAGLRYSPPKLQITTGSRSVCGTITANGAQYCPQQRTVAIRIMKRDLRDQIMMNLAHSVAHEWGHHVQELTGILDAQNTLYWRSGKTQRAALSRRLEMQAECFAGVFYRSTLDSLSSEITWVQWIDGVKQSRESKVHGKPRNLAYWQDRGYDAASARACNTWTAPNARVS